MKRVGEDLGGNARTLSSAPPSPQKSGCTTDTTEAARLAPNAAAGARQSNRRRTAGAVSCQPVQLPDSLLDVNEAALLADPERVVDVPPDAVPALLVQLAALQIGLAARLAVVSAVTPDEPDRLLTIDEAAERLAVTKDWLRRRSSLPFVVKLSDGVVRYSSRALDRFIAG